MRLHPQSCLESVAQWCFQLVHIALVVCRDVTNKDGHSISFLTKTKCEYEQSYLKCDFSFVVHLAQCPFEEGSSNSHTVA